MGVLFLPFNVCKQRQSSTNCCLVSWLNKKNNNMYGKSNGATELERFNNVIITGRNSNKFNNNKNKSEWRKKPKAYQLFRREIRLEDTRFFLFHGYLTPLVRLMNALNIKYFSKFVLRCFCYCFRSGCGFFFPTNHSYCALVILKHFVCYKMEENDFIMLRNLFFSTSFRKKEPNHVFNLRRWLFLSLSLFYVYFLFCFTIDLKRTK